MGVGGSRRQFMKDVEVHGSLWKLVEVLEVGRDLIQVS